MNLANKKDCKMQDLVASNMVRRRPIDLASVILGKEMRVCHLSTIPAKGTDHYWVLPPQNTYDAQSRKSKGKMHMRRVVV
jgi:hypothetical protein